MKTKKKVLIGLMALCLAGGIGSAFALTSNAANRNLTGNTDKAVYLYWGNGTQTNAAIDPVTSLVKDTAQYRFVNIQPKTSTNLSGTVRVTFTISAHTDEVGKTAVLTGLTVRVYETESQLASGTAYAALHPAENAPSPDVILTPSALTGYIDVTVTASYSATHYFAMEFVHDGTAAGENEVFGGLMTVSQSFTPAA